MENVIQSNEQSQYLSLIVKKISKDRFSKKELESYNYLKIIVDPLGDLENELSGAWRHAEYQYMAEKISFDTVNVNGISFYKGFHNFKNLLKRLNIR